MNMNSFKLRIRRLWTVQVISSFIFFAIVQSLIIYCIYIKTLKQNNVYSRNTEVRIIVKHAHPFQTTADTDRMTENAVPSPTLAFCEFGSGLNRKVEKNGRKTILKLQKIQA